MLLTTDLLLPYDPVDAVVITVTSLFYISAVIVGILVSVVLPRSLKALLLGTAVLLISISNASSETKHGYEDSKSAFSEVMAEVQGQYQIEPAGDGQLSNTVKEFLSFKPETVEEGGIMVSIPASTYKHNSETYLTDLGDN